MTTAAVPSNGTVPTPQTTVQLLEQLRRQAFRDAELQRVRAACGLACDLFSGRLHAVGKPYLAHCTGAAGAAAALVADGDVVTAALLHGAYAWGDFGPWRAVLRQKRRYLRRHIGERAEGYVFGFQMLPWNTDAIGGFLASSGQLDASARTVVALRLVSELDNLRDGSVLYRADAERVRAALRTRGPILTELAGRLGLPDLAAALAAEVERTFDRVVDAELRGRLPTGTLLPPASARRRLAATVGGALLAVARRRRARSRASPPPAILRTRNLPPSQN